MKKSIFKAIGLIFILSASISGNVLADSNTFKVPEVKWERYIGGFGEDQLCCIEKTVDGGCIIVGTTESTQRDDGLVVKIRNDGKVEWKKCIGGSGYDNFYKVKKTKDEGYIIVGCTNSEDGDIKGYHGDDRTDISEDPLTRKYFLYKDGLIIKLNKQGEIEWQKCIGGKNEDKFFDIKQTTDGGYIAIGQTTSNNGDISDNSGDMDGLVVKLDDKGDIEWEKCINSDVDNKSYPVKQTEDKLYSVQQTEDGGYLIVGDTSIIMEGNRDKSSLFLKLDKKGNIQWNKKYKEFVGFFKDITATKDGGYVLSGYAGGSYNGLIVKLNKNYEIEWTKNIKGNSLTLLSEVQQTNDGGYIAVGNTESSNGDIIDNHGYIDAVIVKVDKNGKKQWIKCFGGTKTDKFTSIQQIDDDQYMAVGLAPDSHIGLKDGWIVKLSKLTVDSKKAIIKKATKENTSEKSSKENKMADEIITFIDRNFENVIRAEIDKLEGDIYKSDLEKIKKLNASYRGISNINGIEYLKNLEYLNLAENQIKDLSRLSKLKKLDHLDLSKNQISDIRKLSELTELINLNLDNNKIKDISSLRNLKKLWILGLRNNEISDISVLKNLIKLTNLSLSYNQISDISVLSSLTKLEGLGLNGNKIEDISSLENLTNLIGLCLEENQIIDIDALKNLTKLKRLYLDKNQISDICPLSNLTNLEFLILKKNKITDFSPTAKYYEELIYKDFELKL